METEKIDVPKFEGFECIGWAIPAENLPCSYIDGVRKSLQPGSVLETSHYICYRKIKPKRITFEFTGEDRAPRKDEWHQTFFGDICKAERDFIEPRKILRLVEEQS
jgi:hypothetical protein